MFHAVVSWVVRHLESRGWLVWRSDSIEHAPMIALHPMYRTRVVVSVKKAMRSSKTPEVTINKEEFNQLVSMCDSGPVWVMFIDAFERCIYSMNVSAYKDQVRIERGKVCIHLGLMKYVRPLELSELRELGEVPARYACVTRFFDMVGARGGRGNL